MSQIKQIGKLRDEINAILVPLKGVDAFYRLVQEPLAGFRRGLAEGAVYDKPWPLLPMAVCEAICQDYDKAIPAAAAFQLLLAAGDVFDDIEDADSPDSLLAKYGSGISTNTATTLLILAEKALTRLKQRDVEDRIIVRVIDEVNSFYTTACLGQHEDISLSKTLDINEETYLKIVSQKSASQIECACRIGAIIAGGTQPLVEAFSFFGQNLGMAAQLTNDIHGITRGKDIVRGKLTLPVIFALNHSDQIIRSQLEPFFTEESRSLEKSNAIKDLLFRVGAVEYTVIKIEYFKQSALNYLEQADKLGAKTEQLKIFFD